MKPATNSTIIFLNVSHNKDIDRETLLNILNGHANIAH